jgi:hypothetical protein
MYIQIDSNFNNTISLIKYYNMYLAKEPKYLDKIQNIIKISTLLVENIFKREVEVFKFDRIGKVKDLIDNKDKSKWYYDCIDLSAYLTIFLELKHETEIFKQLGDNRPMFKRFLVIVREYRNDIAHNKLKVVNKEILCERLYIIKLFISLVIDIDKSLIKKKYYEFMEKMYFELSGEVTDIEAEPQPETI